MSQNGSVAFLEAFGKAVTEQEQRSGFPSDSWRAGGRATKANPNKEDSTWWVENGSNMFDSFVQWWEANNNWYVWQTPTGQLGVELALFSDFQGVPVRAFADLVCYDQDGQFAVVDFKTGSSMPNSGMQLGLYATLIEMLFGVRPTRGYFYDARKGVMQAADDIDRWTKPVFDHMFGKFAQAVEAAILLPNLGMMCSSCGVKESCYAYSGNREIDPLGSM